MKSAAMKDFIYYWTNDMTREEFNEIMDELFEEAGLEIENNECEADSITYMALITTIEEELDIELPDEFLVLDSLKNIELFKNMIFDLV